MRVEQVYYVNEYITDRAYGGPEEGGWWYDCGKFVKCRGMFTTEEEAGEHRDRLREQEPKPRYGLGSVLCAGVTEFNVEVTPGKDYPEERPCYE